MAEGAAPTAARVLRTAGWTFITAGVVVLLYLVYSLFFTNLSTRAAQADLLERWRAQVATGVVDDSNEEDQPPPDGASPQPVAASQDAVAVITFFRPGASEPPVHAEPLAVVPGVTLAHLERGPGHYPDTADPGERGNFAVAGHRTTYGAPFFRLDELIAGDQIHVFDRGGQRHVYEVVALQIVTPQADWVLGDDPLGRGTPTLTLTTCHPRFSARERLVVFAELLRTEPAGEVQL